MANRNRPASVAEPTPDPDATQPLATTDADRERHIAGLREVDTTQPLDQRGNGQAMVPARIESDIAEATRRGVKLARNAEHKARAAAMTTDANRVGNLIDLLIQAGDQQDARDLVPGDLIAQVRGEVDGWAKDRGVS